MRKCTYTIAVLTAVLALAAALVSCGGGGDSTSSSFRNNAPQISAPASFIALASSGSVTLSWSSVSGANSYRIYRSTSTPVTKASGSLLVTGLSPTMTTYRDATVSDFTTYYYVMTSVKNAVESAESPEVSATPGGPAGAVQGTVLYEDKEYGAGTFTGVTKWRPVRYAAIDIVDAGSSAVLFTGQTDSQGRYTIVTVPSSTLVKVSVKSTATPPGAGTISTRNLSNNLYGVPSDTFRLSVPAGVSIAISVTNGSGGAFSILDVMTTGYDFVKHLEMAYPSASLNAYWAPTNVYGTFFCYGGCPADPGGDGIYVLSTAADTDQYDDDVLWHEFGHFLAYTYSVDQSTGGPHSLSDVDHDLRFSWSEGWGDFMPGAVKSWLAATDPSRLSSSSGLALTEYVDTPTFHFDFGSATMSATYSYATGETAVAKVLHGVRSAFSMQDIWDIFTSFTTAVTSTHHANLELFWDQWLASKPATTGATSMQAIFADRQIRYQADGYENDDSLVTAKTITVGITQAGHTLYGDGDWDHVKFTPAASTSYTIRTSSLRNGADTYLELYDDIGALIAANDNTVPLADSIPPFNCSPPPPFGSGICRENGSDILASTIQFTTSSATPSGPYTIKVYSNTLPGKPVSAGRYGTYDLRVTTP